jgi:hypothetical protein
MSKSTDAESMRKTLEESLGESEWVWLARHAERNAVILVAPGLDLLETGLKIAQDDTATVGAWIAARKLSKPTREQLDAWNAEPTKKFLSVVVQPYVLVQEIVH